MGFLILRLSSGFVNIPSSFVTRQGSSLYWAGAKFTFSGANIYWLGLDENVGGIAYPTYFRIDDVLATARLMGANVVRTFGAVSLGCKLCVEPTLNNFNDSGFQALDYAINSARDHNIKLILPLVDNWHYYHGGKHNFTDWRGLNDEEQFYTNQTVISDFKNYIRHILTHVNPYTHLAYKDDPTIMIWETGNELRSSGAWKYAGWTGDIASYIKSIAPYQLVADGHSANGENGIHLDPDSLLLGNVDIYSGHFYPPQIEFATYDQNLAKQTGKVYFIGEYDWTGPLTGEIAADNTIDETGTQSARVTVYQSSPSHYFVQLMQYGLPFEKGKQYTISFFAKASKPRTMDVVLQQGYAQYNVYVENKVYIQKQLSIDKTMQQYKINYIPNISDQNVMLALNFASSIGQVWLDDVRIMDQANKNMLQNSSFETKGGNSFAGWDFQTHSNTNIPRDSLTDFLAFSENPTSNVSGDLFWSLFGHNDKNGFVYHDDGFTIHYPGDTDTMAGVVRALTKHAYAKRGLAVPSLMIPQAPLIYPLNRNNSGISVNWRGSAGAASYVIERSNDGLNWNAIATITDNDSPYLDTNVKSGQTNFYRIKANNLDGFSKGYSSVARMRY